MDYVYICRRGENEELRYSLRSLEKNMPEGDVWVVGYRPEWYVGNFIHIENISDTDKFINIKNCIKEILNNDLIKEDFVLMNDDFFALKKINSVTNFDGGLLEDKIIEYKNLGRSSRYIKLLELTLKQLKQNGIDNPLDYDIHVPMLMKKSLLKEVIDLAYFPRSTYGNFAQLKRNTISDVKMYELDNVKIYSQNKNFISTEDNSFRSLKKHILFKEFIDISKCENPTYSRVPNGI